ncbi:MAG: hypothetical protein AMJ54_06835 [Deltaproteobacteria bacterium SG8_13]|nr:MAG: hypothetical protein AMJ54_06835 [Deltaproteobacteria bacterium SG8_13]
MLLTTTVSAADQQLYLIQQSGLAIRFEPQLQAVAREVAEVYPRINDELQQVFGWETTFRPTVFLIGDRQRFQNWAENPSIVAYARPGDNVIVIDCSRLHIRPHRLESVLKHEMIHLLLHRHIRGDLLPRWLDEGVAQWFSGGLAELLTAPHPSLLEEALLSGEFIPLDQLDDEFPRSRMDLLLAYEESRSFAAHIAAGYGEQKIIQLLNRLKDGTDLREAFEATLNMELHILEQKWIEQLQSRYTWYSYLAVHLYEFLFLAAALLTVIGFVRFVLKKRAYRDEEEE